MCLSIAGMERLDSLEYGATNGLFKRLAKKTGIKASPHLMRHSHATELIRAGWDMAHVQKRLGHANIQTTINTYVHLMMTYSKNIKSIYNVEKRAMEIDRSYVNTLANDKSETLSLTETELRLVDNKNSLLSLRK